MNGTYFVFYAKADQCKLYIQLGRGNLRNDIFWFASEKQLI